MTPSEMFLTQAIQNKIDSARSLKNRAALDPKRTPALRGKLVMYYQGRMDALRDLAKVLDIQVNVQDAHLPPEVPRG